MLFILIAAQKMTHDKNKGQVADRLSVCTMKESVIHLTDLVLTSF